VSSDVASIVIDLQFLRQVTNTTRCYAQAAFSPMGKPASASGRRRPSSELLRFRTLDSKTQFPQTPKLCVELAAPSLGQSGRGGASRDNYS
jgi:hypothetical protein